MNFGSFAHQKILHSQARVFVSNDHKLMRREAEASEVLVDLKKVKKLVAQASVLKWTVIHINNEFKATNSGKI